MDVRVGLALREEHKLGDVCERHENIWT